MATQKPILICGAGLASLLLAQSLRRASVPFQIFERDSSMSFRAQGYRLRLSNEGLEAIKEVLGPQEFERFWARCSKTGGGGFSTLDAVTGEELPWLVAPAATTTTKATNPGGGDGGGDDDGGGGGAAGPTESLTSLGGKIVGISRGDMRALFATGCEPHIQWSREVTGYEVTEAGTGVRALFADGSVSVEGAMLVGGEGVRSKIARQLSGGRLKVYDTGARGIHGQAPRRAFAALGEGVWRLVDDSDARGRVSIMTNVRGAEEGEDDVLGWTMGAQPGRIQMPGDDDDNSGRSHNNDAATATKLSLVGAQAAALARELTRGWHERFRPLFEEMVVSEAAFWKITCSTPTGVPEWRNEPRVTVIGDAVHAMTHAGGIGANTAVQDSALLGRLLGAAGGFGEDVTAAYEREMRVYASEAVRTSYGLAVTQFGVRIDEESKCING